MRLASLRKAGLALVLALYQGIVALIVSWPIEAAVRAAYGQNLQGDAPLWREGGLELLDLLLHGRAAWSPLVTGMLVTLAFGALLGVAPLALVVRSLGDLDRGTWKPLRARVARSSEAWGTLLLVWIAYLAVVALAVFAVRSAAHLAAAVTATSGNVTAQKVGWAIGACVLLAFFPLNVLHDRAQVAVVLDGRGFIGAWKTAVQLVRPNRRYTGLVFGWTWRATLGLLFVAAGGQVASRFGGLGGAALVELFLAHQLVVLVRAWLRVDWLDRLIATSEPAVHLSIEDAIAPTADFD